MPLFSWNVPPENAPMPKMVRIGPVIVETYTETCFMNSWNVLVYFMF